jgi:hypothetical protein
LPLLNRARHELLDGRRDRLEELVEDLLVAAVVHGGIVHLARETELLEARSSTMPGVFALADGISLGRFLLEATRPEPGEVAAVPESVRRDLPLDRPTPDTSGRRGRL